MQKYIFTFFLALTISLPAWTQLAVKSLRCENLNNPAGLDVPQPRFGWQLASDQQNILQTAYEIRVATSEKALQSGKNLLWTSGKKMSDVSQWITYSGPALQSSQKYFWQVRVWDNQKQASPWSEVAYWQVGLLNAADWKAKWIMPGFLDTVGMPNPYFRKTFSTKKKIASATAFITAHGLYEAWINGQRVGDAYLTPGWTSYNKRLQYQAYDVTNLLTNGNNAVGAVLGSGWYRGNLGWSTKYNIYGRDIALLFQLEIIYTDGTKETIGSDDSWKSDTGAIRFTEIYHGETIDTRLEQKGWSSFGFNDGKWSGVEVASLPMNNLVATYNQPVRKHAIFKPKIFRTPKGELVVDFGQNLVGWCVLKLNGEAGEQVSLQHFEVLDKEGNVYMDNMRSAKVTARYILNGEGVQTLEPHFTFFGFRYVKIDGYSSIKPENITAVALYSDMPETGTFSCSNSLLNQLQHNIQWGQRGNFLDVPTDCPQRDERMGWTGDAQAFSRTAMYNFDAFNFFAKWARDIDADQYENGSVPFVIPAVLGDPGGSTGWADVVTIVPWNSFLVYGDTMVLQKQYRSMKAWVDFMQMKSTNDLWNTGFHFGDWLFYSPGDDDRDGRAAVTDKYMIAQCFYAHSTQLLINAANVLGKNDDVKRYTDLLNRVKAAYQKEYVTPNGRLISGTQTAYVLALHFDMLPEFQRAAAAKSLADNVKSYGNHITTGFLGTPYICNELTRFGYADVAYTLLFQKTYPSWLYPVTMGATTIWERWDGIKPDSTFQTPTMNSFNHYAYGAIGEWMYRTVAGLDADPATGGYKKLLIHPHPSDSLTNARATYESLYGRVGSHWETDDDDLLLHVEIPPNTTAVIMIPAKSATDIYENGKQPVVKAVEGEKNYFMLEKGSGTYHFRSKGLRNKK
jgi:alpha-L-rhamnosidase